MNTKIINLDTLLQVYVTYTRWEVVTVTPVNSGVRVEWIKDRAFENEAIFHKKTKIIKTKDIDDEIEGYKKKIAYEERKVKTATAKAED